MSTELTDQILTCLDCGNRFMWTAGEQQFFHDKGLQNIPKRCKGCTATYKAKILEKHPRFWIKCKKCKQKSEVPFEPKNSDFILCEECFIKQKSERDQILSGLGLKMPSQNDEKTTN